MKCCFFPSSARLSGASKQFRSPLRVLCHAGLGADASRPLCRKAKDVRKERRLQKEHVRHKADGVSSDGAPAPPATSQTNQPKLLEDFISESAPNDSSHSLEVSGTWSWRSALPLPDRERALGSVCRFFPFVSWGVRLVWVYGFFQPFFPSPSDFTTGFMRAESLARGEWKKTKASSQFTFHKMTGPTTLTGSRYPADDIKNPTLIAQPERSR